MKVRNKAFQKAFGAHLKQLIDARKKSPDDIASYANIETKQVYRVINGEHSTTLSTIYAIAQALELHPKELFSFDFTDGKA